MLEIKEHVASVSQWTTKEGLLCEENMRGTRFNLMDCTLHADFIQCGTGQIMLSIRRVCFAAEKSMILVEITCPQDAMSGVYSCMQPRRGQIFEENPREGTPLIQVKAYLSVSESFSFVAALRQATSGQAFPQCVLDYWEVVPGDGMVEDKPARDAFRDSVYRDISWWSELLLALKVFAGILFTNQSHHMSAIDCIAKLAEKKTALEGVQEFEILFGTASVTGKLFPYTYVPALVGACGHNENPVAKVASALLTTMYAACLTWSGAYVLPLLKEGLQAKAKPEVKIVARDRLRQLAVKYAESTSLEIEWCVHLLSILMNNRSESESLFPRYCRQHVQTD